MPASTLIVSPRKCKPFLIRVMVFSPESGFKFEIEVQRACTAADEPVWSLHFSLKEKQGTDFVELVAVEFIAGTPDEVTRVAAISDEGLTRAQVRAFRDHVYPEVKKLDPQKEDPKQEKVVHDAMKSAIAAK